jgi:tRNA/tmRNA/rRNA uracil-C5-methylase (TrmA/RlmC/RlmD family)
MLRQLPRLFKIGKSPCRDEIFQIPIEGLDKEGRGIVTIEWDTMQKQIEPTHLVVRGALPGETVRFRVVSVYSKGGSAVHTVNMNLFGRREHLIRPQQDNQPWRSTIETELLPSDHKESSNFSPFNCPHFDRRHDEQSCSKCTVPHLNYTRQLIDKTKLLRNSLAGAVDDHFLNKLEIEAKSQISHFSTKHEIFAFSKRPLQTPVWGQLSHQAPLPGEPRTKYFIPTPECRLLPKSARAVFNRLEELVAIAHESNPEEFSVYNEVINRGFMRSVILQSAKNRNEESQVLLTLVTARETTGKMRSEWTSKVVDRLMTEFPKLLKGVVLVEARVDGKRDDEFFSNRQVLAGDGFISQYIEAADREVQVNPTSPGWGGEIGNKITQELNACIRSDERILELFSGDRSLTGILKQLSTDVTSLGAVNEDGLLRIGADVVGIEENVGNQLMVAEGGSSSISIQGADEVGQPVKVRDLPAGFKGTAVLSFPKNEKSDKPEIKGVTSKVFRHWLGNVLRPNRIVIVTEEFDGLRKDIGHMKLLGYEMRRIKAFDTMPGRMDKILTVVMMERKPKYKPLERDQIIE